VLISIPPLGDGDLVLRTFADTMARAPHLKWIGYLSTVGVYGDRDGAWVDETTPPAPTEPRSQARAAVEAAWLAFGAAHGRPTHLFRLAGIYGPDRNALKQLAAGTARRIVKPGRCSTAFHVDDIAATVAASLNRPRHGAVYNLSDTEPAPPQDVGPKLRQAMRIAPPPEVALDDAGLSHGPLVLRECKRVDGRRTREELGVTLRYPTIARASPPCALPAKGRRKAEPPPPLPSPPPFPPPLPSLPACGGGVKGEGHVPARLGATGRWRAAGSSGTVARIAAAQVSTDIGIAAAPEAGQITRHLHRPPCRRQQFKHQGHTAAGNARMHRQPEQLLQPHRDRRPLRGLVIDRQL